MDVIGDFIRDLQDWLLGPKIQFREGPHRGGVAGWLDEGDEPVFIYPEITGYYLTWLAFLSEKSGFTDELAERSTEALRWIARNYCESASPPTRIYVRADRDEDWRNSGTFAFDLAMLARGTVAARHLSDTPQRRELLTCLLTKLIPFCLDSEALTAFLPHDPETAAIPVRWSCSSGPYQAKVAAAILSAGAQSPLPELLHSSAEAAYQNWRGQSSVDEIHEEPHPAFYHLEGLALAAANGWDPDGLKVAADVWLRAVGLNEPAASYSHFFNGASSESRSDILAQALRIGCILRSRGLVDDPGMDGKLVHLFNALRGFADDGAILFAKASPRHRNVWSAIFTHQALCFYEAVSAGRPIPDRWMQLLV